MLCEGGLGDAARLFQEQDFEVDEAEPSRIGDVVVVAALEFRKDIAQRFREFTLGVRPHGEVLTESLAKPLNRIGRTRAKNPCVRFDL